MTTAFVQRPRLLRSSTRKILAGVKPGFSGSSAATTKFKFQKRTEPFFMQADVASSSASKRNVFQQISRAHQAPKLAPRPGAVAQLDEYRQHQAKGVDARAPQVRLEPLHLQEADVAIDLRDDGPSTPRRP